MAVADRKRSPSNAATTAHTPHHLRSRGHLVHICELFRFSEELRPLAMAQADRAGAYRQHPLVEEDKPPAVATLQNPGDAAFMLDGGCATL